MMIIGIAGCMALVMAGLGIKDSISNLAEFQYDEIEVYDLSVLMKNEIDDDVRSDISKRIKKSGVEDYELMELYRTSLEMHLEDSVKTIYVCAGNGEEIRNFVNLENDDRIPVQYPETGCALVSEKLCRITGKKVGTATVTATAVNGKKASVKISVLFTDVPQSGVYYSKAVYWAYGKGITYGYTDADGLARTFGPEKDCTRAHMVTFLWRMAGKPNPGSMTSRFKDVKDRSMYYYKAVLWAAEKGITSGKTAEIFAPDETCTRAQIVTFLYRAAGAPMPTSEITFTDVAPDAYYYDALRWAVEQGIANGFSPERFYASATVKRAQVAAFLWRASLSQNG
jgi:hypothetical protein